MVLSKNIIEILKNFSTINQGIVIKKGNILKTMNVLKNTFAIATVPDTFDKEFAIYDLTELLDVYASLDPCEVDFKEKKLVVSNGVYSINYFYSNPSVVISPGDKNIVLPSKDKHFTLTREVFNKILKTSSIMKLRDIQIDSKGITVLNRNTAGENPIGNTLDISIDVTCEQSTKPSFMKIENLKLIPLDYEVFISEKGIAHFLSRNEEYKLEYFITLDIE